nr:glycosyltransferase family A protein [Motilibacter aurantiacus]
MSLVVSTIGRPDKLRRLLASVEASDAAAEVELVLVDQTPDTAALAELDAWQGTFRRVGVTSPRGLSIGRNAGLAHAVGDVVAFPDDDCWYPPQTLGQALRRMRQEPELGGVSGRQLTADGRSSMLRWAPDACDVTRWNFYRTGISSTLFLRRALVDAAGGFDPMLGAGSAGPWRSGEETDVVMHGIELGWRIAYDPALVVLQDEPRDEPDRAFIEKMLGYGRGQGRLWRKRGLPPALLGYIAARKLVGATVRAARGRRDLTRADVAYVRGLASGLWAPGPLANDR